MAKRYNRETLVERCAEVRVRRPIYDALCGSGIARAQAVAVTSSPLGHTALDIYQKSAERAAKRAINMPIIHFEQLLALSFGIHSKELGLDRHMVPTKSLLARLAA